MAEFKSFMAALKWARTYARECCLPCHEWEITKLGESFVVAIKFKSSGDLAGYATV